MATPMSTHGTVSAGKNEMNDKVTSGKNESCEHQTTVSNELLYSENYSECYQADRLTVVGKGNKKPLVKGLLKTVDLPQSSVLCRLKSFLPELSVANRNLATLLANNPDTADKFNIEHLDESDDEHVEMNLSVIPPELLDDKDSTSEESESDSGTDSPEEIESPMKGVKCVLKLYPASSKFEKPGIQVIEDIPLNNNSTEKNVTER